MKIKNVSPFGDLDLPLIGRVVEYGEEFEVSDDIGEQIVEQETNWEWLDRPKEPKKSAKSDPEGGDL